MEIIDQASSRGVFYSKSVFLRLRAGKTSTWINPERNHFSFRKKEITEDRPNISKSNKQPCSSTQVNLKSKNFTVPKLTVPPTEMRAKKTLKFDSNVFVTSVAPYCVG